MKLLFDAAASRRQIIAWFFVLLTAGFLCRLALVLLTYDPADARGEEPSRIAMSLISTGRYADGYGSGAGLTAHCPPLYPLILSLVYGIFGTGAKGMLAVSVCAAAAAALAFALLPALAVAARVGLPSGVIGGIAGALVPVNYWAQTSGAFDAPYTAAMLVLVCYLLCRSLGRFSTSDALLFGAAAGFACLLNSVAITVLLSLAAVLLALNRDSAARVLRFFGIAALCVASILAPWAIRNYLAFGSFIWTRSNFGLELQVSNNDLMTADLERNLRKPEFVLLHPHAGDGEREKVRRLGELAYQRAKKEQAITWILANKGQFLRLTLERFRLFWIPNMNRPLQRLAAAGLTIAALCGLMLLFRRKHIFGWLALAVLAGYSAVYYVIQASPRYRLPVEPFLFLLTAYALVAVFRPWLGPDAEARSSSAQAVHRSLST